jgi:hypothetical protein
MKHKHNNRINVKPEAAPVVAVNPEEYTLDESALQSVQSLQKALAHAQIVLESLKLSIKTTIYNAVGIDISNGEWSLNTETGVLQRA